MPFYYGQKICTFPNGSLTGEPMILSKIPNIFRAYFSVKETLVLSFHDVDFLQGGFLDDKNVILL